MAGKEHARQVEHLPLVPLGRAPDAAQAGHLRQAAPTSSFHRGSIDFQDQAMAMDRAGEVIDQFQVAAASRRRPPSSRRR